jgi:hypothetical protein
VNPAGRTGGAWGELNKITGLATFQGTRGWNVNIRGLPVHWK